MCLVQNIIVVGHHNVYLGMLGVSFHNCEVRKYRFDGTGRQGDGSFSDSAMPDVPAAVPPLLSTFEAIEPQVRIVRGVAESSSCMRH